MDPTGTGAKRDANGNVVLSNYIGPGESAMETDRPVSPPEPTGTLTAVEPSHGPANTPVAVVISGTGLLDVTGVTFDALPGVNIWGKSDTSFHVQTPILPEGAAAIVVQHPEGDITNPSVTFTTDPFVDQTPTASFSIADNTAGLVQFYASGSIDPDGGPLVFKWDFGDGANNLNGGVAPTHQYAPGSYTCTLIVTDDEGNDSAPTTQPVEVL